MDSDNHNFSVSSGGDNDGEPREKGLPTIFKYQGQGKEVYVCGKLLGIKLGWVIKCQHLDQRAANNLKKDFKLMFLSKTGILVVTL